MHPFSRVIIAEPWSMYNLIMIFIVLRLTIISFNFNNIYIGFINAVPLFDSFFIVPYALYQFIDVFN